MKILKHFKEDSNLDTEEPNTKGINVKHIIKQGK